jgi:hypothetical protein
MEYTLPQTDQEFGSLINSGGGPGFFHVESSMVIMASKTALANLIERGYDKYGLLAEQLLDEEEYEQNFIEIDAELEFGEDYKGLAASILPDDAWIWSDPTDFKNQNFDNAFKIEDSVYRHFVSCGEGTLLVYKYRNQVPFKVCSLQGTFKHVFQIKELVDTMSSTSINCKVTSKCITFFC